MDKEKSKEEISGLTTLLFMKSIPNPFMIPTETESAISGALLKNWTILPVWAFPASAIKAGFHLDFLLHFGPSAYRSLFRYEKGRNTTSDMIAQEA